MIASHYGDAICSIWTMLSDTPDVALSRHPITQTIFEDHPREPYSWLIRGVDKLIPRLI